jgi:hypothetical protein
MWQYTPEGNGCANQCVELFVTADGELKVARGDTLDLEIFRGILIDLISARFYRGLDIM